MKIFEISSKTMSNLDLIANGISKDHSEENLNQMFLANKKRVSACEAGCEFNSCNGHNGA